MLGALLGLSTALIHIPAPTPGPGQPQTFITVAAHEPPTTNPAAATPCSTVERVGLGLEWSVPILATNAGKSCILNATTPAGQWITAGSWVFRLGGWALATLAVAGYTGIVRRV